MKKMKKSQKSRFLLLCLLVFTFLLVVPSPVFAQSGDGDDQVVLGGRFHLRSDETVNGDLIIIGGTAVLDEGSRVNGNVLLTGGSIEVSGTIDGDITAFGGSVNLLANAVIHGDVILTSASYFKSPDAIINGDIKNNITSIDGFNLDNLPSVVLPEPDLVSPFRTWINFLTGLLWGVLRILAVSGLAALVVLLAQKPTERVANSISSQPLIASGFGLLTAIVAPALLLLLTITIILIPVGLVGILILAIAGLFGWVAIGYEIGYRVEKALKQNWAPAITAGIGTFLLSIATSIFGIVPCIGWIIPTLISILGLGGVLISRFGTQVYGTAIGASTVRPTETSDSMLNKTNSQSQNTSTETVESQAEE